MIAPEASLVMPTGGRGGFAGATAYHAFWAAGAREPPVRGGRHLLAVGCRFTAAVDAPGNQTKGVVMNARRATVLTVVGLALFLAAITLGTAAASPIKWVSVPLGTHQFGHLRSPDGIVAQAGQNEVGFKKGGTGCGCMDGPGGPVSFDVARNGS